MDEVGSRRRAYALATSLLALIIVLVSVLGAVWASTSLREAQDDLAADLADDLAVSVRTVIERDAAVATALAGRIAEPSALDQDRWSSFVQRPWRTGAFRQVAGVNLAVRVTDDEQLERLVDRLADGAGGELDLRLGEGPTHLLLATVWPEPTNRDAVGFDVFANPVAADAARQAMRLGTPAASAPLTLVQEREQQRSTVVYVPVFTSGADRVGGVISLTFRAEELLAQVLPRAGEDAQIRWIDEGSGEALVGDESAGPGDAAATVQAFGARWRFEVVAPSVSVSPAAELAPFGILLTGLVLAAGVLLLVANESRLTRRAEELAEQRGAELEDRNADLRRANARLQDLDEVKDRVLRSVTHDLRNPITVIGGLTEVLQNHDVPEGQRVDLLGRIAHQAERLTALTVELETAARLQSGQLTAERRPVDVVATVRRVVTDVGVGEVVVAGWVPPAEVDPHHLERVVANLLTNARRHGEPPVTVEVGAVDGHVEVAVRDHGPGVDTHDRERLFEEFTRLRASGEGLGLGLAICAGLAALNGGDVRYEVPGDGPGARFVLRLERSLGEGAAAGPGPSAARFPREPAAG